MIGLEANVTYNGAEHQDLQYVKHTLVPWIRRIEDEITAKLLREGERGQVIPRFDLNTAYSGETPPADQICTGRPCKVAG